MHWLMFVILLVLLWAFLDSGWFGVKNVLGCLGMIAFLAVMAGIILFILTLIQVIK